MNDLERSSPGPVKRYGYNDRAAEKPPDYARVAAALPDAELEDEILAGRGDTGYQAALVAEQEARARRGAPS